MFILKQNARNDWALWEDRNLIAIFYGLLEQDARKLGQICVNALNKAKQNGNL